MRNLQRLAVTVLVFAAAAPANAQMGTSSNVPPQHLFDTDHPQRLNTGTGTMAERRLQLSRLRKARPIAPRARGQ